jgi:hypothetical protein
VNDAPELGVAADKGVEAAAGGLAREVLAEALEGAVRGVVLVGRGALLFWVFGGLFGFGGLIFLLAFLSRRRRGWARGPAKTASKKTHQHVLHRLLELLLGQLLAIIAAAAPTTTGKAVQRGREVLEAKGGARVGAGSIFLLRRLLLAERSRAGEDELEVRGEGLLCCF